MLTNKILYNPQLLKSGNPLNFSLMQNQARKFHTSSIQLSDIQNITSMDSRDLVNDYDFYEFLRGLSDGEANFQITQDRRGDSNFKFKFRIGMHINDRPLLVYLQNRLGIGKIYPLDTANIMPEKDKLVATWEVYSSDDLLKIINLP
jgi:hypothetical protein